MGRVSSLGELVNLQQYKGYNIIYYIILHFTCLRSASACINCEHDAFACSQAAANMNDPSMNEHAITVNAAILAIWTAVGRVLSLYA